MAKQKKIRRPLGESEFALYSRLGPDCLVLKPGEFEQLLPKAQQGDKAARDRCILGNLRLVMRIAAGFYQSGSPSIVTLGDLVDEGIIGLIDALGKFDLKRGVKFSTYASWWIKHYIRTALHNRLTVRLPNYLHAHMTRYGTIAQMMYEKTGKFPTFDEVTAKMRLSKMRKRFLLCAFLARPGAMRVIQEGAELLSPPQEEVDDSLQVLSAALCEAMSQLSLAHRSTLEMYFGLKGGPLNHAQIAQMIGLSSEGVRRRYKVAMDKLRQLLQEKLKP
jgi:RNA polymerase sigma factor (sigma-70 family)